MANAPSILTMQCAASYNSTDRIISTIYDEN